MSLLHRRTSALLALIALLAFVAGAGFDAPSVIPATLVLLVAVFWQPAEDRARALEPLWRAAALVLAARAALIVAMGGGDPVLSMVDLLLLLLCAESLQVRDGSGDARHFALTFALLIASAAYRPGPLFGLLFVAYVMCATLVLVLGHLTRQARSRQLEPPPAKPLFLARVALLSLVVLLVSGIVFLLFPRVSRVWAVRPEPTSAVVGFSDNVSLDGFGATIEANPEIVMRVEFPEDKPADLGSLHWRGRAYDHFDGWSWSRSQIPPMPLFEATHWQSPIIDQIIYAYALTDMQVLFGLHPVIDIAPLSAISVRRVAQGDFVYYGDTDPVYRVRSRVAEPAVAVLRTSSFDTVTAAAQQLREHWADSPEVLHNLQLPPLSTRLRALADSFRVASPTLYDHVSSIERWLRSEFRYTLELPQTRREATLDHFIFERRAGHCEYFSTALAVLLRAGGVPARNVNGFLGGEWNDFGSFLTVTQNHAHSWVEVFFPGIGWITSDPTPAAAASFVGETRTRLLGRARLVLEGVEHRWSKWVLDYDIGRQTSLLQQLRRPFSSAPSTDATDTTARTSYVRLILASVVLLVGAVLALRQMRWRTSRRSPDTRLYLSMRRAYERAGYPGAAVLPPLAFTSAVTTAPGGADARRAVELYLQARFGGESFTEPQRAEFRQHITAARRALRRR